jgi:hypothetical protein
MAINQPDARTNAIVENQSSSAFMIKTTNTPLCAYRQSA